MAYDVSKLTKLEALKALAQRTKSQTDALGVRVKTIEDAGYQPNVLEGVKVNGAALEIANKIVDILIATGSTDGTISVAGVDVAVKGLAALAYKAEITQDELSSALSTVIAGKAEATNVYSKTEIDAKISAVYKPTGSVAFADLPTLDATVLGNVYNVTNAFTTTADFVEGAGHKHSAGTNVVVVNVGSAETPSYKFDVLSGVVDLTGYYTKTEADDQFVAKNGTDRLITATEGTKLAGIAEGATKVEAGTTAGKIKINGTDTTVVEIATNEEVTEMLNEVFGASQA